MLAQGNTLTATALLDFHSYNLPENSMRAYYESHAVFAIYSSWSAALCISHDIRPGPRSIRQRTQLIRLLNKYKIVPHASIRILNFWIIFFLYTSTF